MPALPDNGLNRKISDSESVAKDCEAVEAEIAALKVSYEQYFLGMERLPPSKQHEELKKSVKRLKGAFVRQTAIKFRINAIQSKFLSYERLWTRTLQEIEDGTYKRDLFKAKRKAAAPAPKKDKAAQEDPLAGLEELDASALLSEEPSPVAPAVPAVAPAVPAVAKVPSSAGVPAVPAAARTASSPGIPAVPAVARTVSSPGIPAVAPAAKPPSSAGVPAVPAAARTVSSPGIPAVPAAARTVSSPGVPAVPPAPPMPQTARAAPPGGAATPAGLRPASSPGTPAVAPRTGPTPAASRPAAPVGGGDVSEAKLKAVYDAYVTAKKRCQEDVSKLSYESVAANLRKQVPELMKKHNASGVEFKVVIKDGKAVLKAVPK